VTTVVHTPSEALYRPHGLNRRYQEVAIEMMLKVQAILARSTEWDLYTICWY